MADQEGNERHEPQKAINSKLPHLFHCLPHSQHPALSKGKWQGTALKGQRPYPEKEKAAPVHSFYNTRSNRPYAVPLPSAAPR